MACGGARRCTDREPKYRAADHCGYLSRRRAAHHRVHASTRSEAWRRWRAALRAHAGGGDQTVYRCGVPYATRSRAHRRGRVLPWWSGFALSDYVASGDLRQGRSYVSFHMVEGQMDTALHPQRKPKAAAEDLA